MNKKDKEENVFNDAKLLVIHQDGVTHTGIDKPKVSQVFLSH